jgi:hypothetical protein
MAPLVAAYQAMRDASFLVAVTFAAQIGDVRRFDAPRQLMSFLGLVPAAARHKAGLAATAAATGAVMGSAGRAKYLTRLTAEDVASRPQTMIALQGYLTQCSPAAIEANINNAANGSRNAA